MSGWLALVGGGEWTEGCTFDQTLLDAAGTDEVVVLPTGSAYENPQRLVDAATTWFESLGAKVRVGEIYTRADAMLDANVAAVRGARFVYLAGASPMHLRSVLKDSPVYDEIESSWRAGGVVAGTNAGADVLCDPMVDSRGGAFTVGLGLVSNLAVIPRANTWSVEKVHRTVELAPAGIDLVAVPEQTAIVRTPDGTWRQEGVGTVAVYRDGRAATLAELTS
jgi:cyanophycinase